MNKTHLLVDPGKSLDVACGRTVREFATTPFAQRTTCGHCRNKDEYDRALRSEIEAREAAFKAQTPRTIVPQFGRVNDDGVMECPWCSGVLWRERPRSLHSYHYVCEGCGKSVYPLTESGMCM